MMLIGLRQLVLGLQGADNWEKMFREDKQVVPRDSCLVRRLNN